MFVVIPQVDYFDNAEVEKFLPSTREDLEILPPESKTVTIPTPESTFTVCPLV